MGHFQKLAVILLISVSAVTCSIESQLEYIAKVASVADAIQKSPELQKHAAAMNMDERIITPVWPNFNSCQVETSPVKPTSVHALRLSDIEVIIAYGDSITAGNGLGAKNLVGVALENRGESWCVGGEKSVDEGVITLTNILRKFNPALKGWSRCSSQWEDFKYSWLNLAEPGATSDDIERQSGYIADRIDNDPRIDGANDWKIATLFIGGNDLCAVCRRDRYCPKSYRDYIEVGLDVLFNRTQRMLVNLVPMMDITPLVQMTRNPLCSFMQKQQMRHIQMRYYEELVDLVESGKYEREDFTVVLQPFMRDLVPPKDPDTNDWDTSYLSKDCFHPSRALHQTMALGLFNSMMSPYGQKVFAMDPGDPNPIMKCPTQEHPYVFTKANSPTFTPTPAPPERTTLPPGVFTICYEGNTPSPTTTTTPTPASTPPPTSAPTAAPTPPPTSAPTAAPTPPPTSAPTAAPTPPPTSPPTSTTTTTTTTTNAPTTTPISTPTPPTTVTTTTPP